MKAEVVIVQYCLMKAEVVTVLSTVMKAEVGRESFV